MDIKKSAVQVCKEFWAPLVLACAWVTYEWFTSAQTERTLANSIKSFGAGFFFTSWLLAQWFRIRKQQKVEGGLSSIEANVNKTLGELETRTRDLACYITGGDSVCYLYFMHEFDEDSNISKLALRHYGEHPLYEISVRISDCDADLANFGVDGAFSKIYDAQKAIKLANLAPNMVQVWPVKLVLGDARTRNFRLSYYARNGHFVQLMKFEKVENIWLFATQVLRKGVLVYEDIPNNFPRNEDGQIDWLGTGKPYI